MSNLDPIRLYRCNRDGQAVARAALYRRKQDYEVQALGEPSLTFPLDNRAGAFAAFETAKTQQMAKRKAAKLELVG